MTDLITDKIVIYFIATIAIIGVLVGTYFLYSLVQIQNEHAVMDMAENQDVQAIKNLTKLIVTNQHNIIHSQQAIQNLSNIINDTLQKTIYSEENNQLLKQILYLLENNYTTK